VSQFAGRAAAVAFVRDSDRGIQVYLSRRPAHFRYYPGAYVFPGGRVESCDADLRVAASREVKEEIGVQIDPQKLILLRESYTSAHAGPVYHLFIFAYAVDGQFPTEPNPEEVQGELWVVARDALVQLNLPYQIGAAVRAIAEFDSVAELLAALRRRGPIGEDL
jgi:8-oxo-dGTP pyrophosphatase MutT (NUDIX family)